MTDTPLTLDEFDAAFLSRWADYTGPVADAARQAAYAAIIKYRKRRGTILVAADAQSDARACHELLEAFFKPSDGTELSQAAHKIGGDEITLRNGPRILVTSGPRRPKALEVIRLISSSTASPKPDESLPDDETVARRVLHVLHEASDADEVDETIMGLAQAMFPDAGIKDVDDARIYLAERFERESRDYWETKRLAGVTDRQQVTGGTFGMLAEMTLRPDDTGIYRPAQPLTRDEQITSPQFERERAENMGRGMNGKPTVIRGSRWRR